MKEVHDEAEAQLKEVAAQLRKPSGMQAIETAEMLNKGNALINRFAFEYLSPGDGDIVLEIGMGNGYFVPEILDIHPGVTYVGCDFSVEMVEEAKRLNKKYLSQNRASFHQHDACSLPFDSNTFSSVLTVNTLYFWEEPQAVFSEIRRVLKPDGKLIIAIRPKHLMEQYPFTRYGFRMYSEQTLGELISENGFRIEEIASRSEPDQEINGQTYQVGALVALAQMA